LSLIHNNHRLPPLRIVLAHRLPGRARPASARNGLGRNSDCGDYARHHQVRRIEAFLQLPVFSLFGGFAAAAHLSQMLSGDWFLCHGSYGNTVSENPTVRMKDELLPRRDLLLARKLDGDVLALTMSESPGRLDDLIDSHNRSAIADGNLFHGRRLDLLHSAFE